MDMLKVVEAAIFFLLSPPKSRYSRYISLDSLPFCPSGLGLDPLSLRPGTDGQMPPLKSKESASCLLPNNRLPADRCSKMETDLVTGSNGISFIGPDKCLWQEIDSAAAGLGTQWP